MTWVGTMPEEEDDLERQPNYKKPFILGDGQIKYQKGIAKAYSLYTDDDVSDRDAYRIMTEISLCKTHKDITLLISKYWQKGFRDFPLSWPRIMQCKKQVGTMILLLAIVAAMKNKVKGNPINYVVVTAKEIKARQVEEYSRWGRMNGSN